MVDWDRVIELREEIGAEDFGEVVEIFLEEVDDAMSVLGDQISELEAQLHFLKGSALNLGFATFAELCQRGESSANAGNLDINLDEIKSTYALSREAFVSGMQAKFAA